MRDYPEYAEFIIIDDDPLGMLITKRIINLHVPRATVITFTNWQPAIKHISRVINGVSSARIYTVLLEIHMGCGWGWEFLEAFQKLDTTIQNSVRLSILSTILNDNDLLNASKYALINSVIEKPLSADKLNKALVPE